MPTSPLAMARALPLSNDSTAARVSRFFSNRSASLYRSLPRASGDSFLQGPSKAFRAAATAISTSFSVASWTDVMTVSSVGLITSKVLPSTPLTNSLLMKLKDGVKNKRQIKSMAGLSGRSYYLQARWLLILAGMRRLQHDRKS